MCGTVVWNCCVVLLRGTIVWYCHDVLVCGCIDVWY